MCSGNIQFQLSYAHISLVATIILSFEGYVF